LRTLCENPAIQVIVESPHYLQIKRDRKHRQSLIEFPYTSSEISEIIDTNAGNRGQDISSLFVYRFALKYFTAHYHSKTAVQDVFNKHFL